MGRPSIHQGCKVEGCERTHKSQGYCASHYKQFRRGQEIAPLLERDYTHSLICEIEGCDQPEKARGLCSTHYKRWERNGSADVVLKPWGRSE